MGERAYFGLWFQGYKNPSQRGEMVASSRHGGGDRKLRDPIFKQKHKRREGGSQSLPPVAYFCQQDGTSLTSLYWLVLGQSDVSWNHLGRGNLN